MTYIWPLTDALSHVTQEYGANPDPVLQPGGHTGMDFGVPVGTPIYAEADGVIVFADWSDNLGWPNPYYIATSAIRPGGAGICVALDVGPFQFWHVHCNDTAMNAGDHVKQGDLIGHTGVTGYAFGAHLHLDVLPDAWNVHSGDGRYGRVNARDVIDGVGTISGQGTVTRPLAANERFAGGSPVNEHTAPDPASPVTRVIPAGQREVWSGWKHGVNVSAASGESNDIWLTDGSGWASVLFFDPISVAGLTDLNPAPAPPPVVVPPVPVTPPVAPPASRLNGFDISKSQHGMDLIHMPGDFVVIKATEGVGFTDPDLATFAAAAPPGKRRMFYHFTRNGATAENTAAAEALYFLAALQPYLRPGDALALDWEAHDGATDGSYGPTNIADSDSALKFLRIIAAATQSVPVIYLNVGAVNGADWSVVEKEFPLWLANYHGPATGFTPPAALPPVSWAAGFKMLQYTSSGRLPGYGSDLDLDVFLGTTADWDALCARTVPPLPGPVTPDKPPVPPVVNNPVVLSPAQLVVLENFATYLMAQRGNN